MILYDQENPLRHLLDRDVQEYNFNLQDRFICRSNKNSPLNWPKGPHPQDYVSFPSPLCALLKHTGICRMRMCWLYPIEFKSLRSFPPQSSQHTQMAVYGLQSPLEIGWHWSVPTIFLLKPAEVRVKG